jgi:hypothetical protein
MNHCANSYTIQLKICEVKEKKTNKITVELESEVSETNNCHCQCLTDISNVNIFVKIGTKGHEPSAVKTN